MDTPINKLGRKSNWKPEYDNNRPNSYPLRIPEDLNERIREQARRHKTTKVAIIISGAEDKVKFLETREPNL